MKKVFEVAFALTIIGSISYVVSLLIAPRDPELSAMEELEPEETIEEIAMTHSHRRENLNTTDGLI